MTLPEATERSGPSWFGFSLTMMDNASVSRDDLIKVLNSKSIGAELLCGGDLIHKLYMKGRNFSIIWDLLNSEKVMRDTFWISLYPGLNSQTLDFLIDTIREEFFKNLRGGQGLPPSKHLNGRF